MLVAGGVVGVVGGVVGGDPDAEVDSVFGTNSPGAVVAM